MKEVWFSWAGTIRRDIVAGEAGRLNREFAYFGLGDPISWNAIGFGPGCDLRGE